MRLGRKPQDERESGVVRCVGHKPLATRPEAELTVHRLMVLVGRAIAKKFADTAGPQTQLLKTVVQCQGNLRIAQANAKHVAAKCL